MGAMAIASTALSGLSYGKNLIDSRNAEKAEIKNVKQKQIIEVNRQKNLLDSQLAARRNQLGAMGINSDGSATAVQEGLIQDSYRNISIRQDLDESNISSIKNKRRMSDENTVIRGGSSLIK